MMDYLKAAPGFRSQWEHFVTRWSIEEHPPYYCAVDELAHYVVGKYASGETAEFESLFGTVERHLAEQDDQITNFVSVGLLETIQNVASHHEFGGQVFRQWMLPKTRLACDRVDQEMREVVEWLERQNPPRSWQFWRRRANVDSKELIAGVESPEFRKILQAEFRNAKKRGR